MSFYVNSSHDCRVGGVPASTRHGPCPSRPMALTHARVIADRCLLAALQPSMLVDSLFEHCPAPCCSTWIAADLAASRGLSPPPFSPWVHAHEHAEAFCAAAPGGSA
jgi:hypothetical protein